MSGPALSTSSVRANAPILVLYVVAILGNAALLFSVEPLFSKLVLPLLGGSSAVWTTCMMFYQAALLAGYAYAHLGTRWLSGRAQAITHVALLAVSCLALPVRVAPGWSPPTSGTPVLWLFGLLTVSLGAPFLALSAGAPLIQRWFAHTGHPRRADPYFLYAASNVGSLVALLAYPTVIEPLLPLSRQARLWSAAYVGLGVVLVLCALVAWRGLTAERTTLAAEQAGAPAPAETPIRAARVARWVALSALPSSLLLGVTTHLSTDVAPVPLLWVGPLALYLATFIWAFGRQARGAPVLLVRVQALVVIPLVLYTAIGATSPLIVGLPWHLVAFTVTALACHARLAADRPPPAALTGYYLWISVGGLLGGAFNSLVAPLLFSAVTEYPVALALGLGLVAAARPGSSVVWRGRDLIIAGGSAPWRGAVCAWPSPYPADGGLQRLALLGGLAVVAVLLLAAAERPWRLGLAATLALAGIGAARAAATGSLFAGRSFYGAYRVTTARGDSAIRILEHGTTIHGAQDTRPALSREPRTYYARSGPVGDLFAALPPAVTGGRIGAVGLGSGSLACYARPGARWTFFEIDPLMVRIARDPALFTFLSACAPDAQVVLGDARLALARRPARRSICSSSTPSRPMLSRPICSPPRRSPSTCGCSPRAVCSPCTSAIATSISTAWSPLPRG
jgi:hypothetical protein